MHIPLRDLGALACLLAFASGCASTAPGRQVPTLHIYLARHGQTDWNAEHRLQGWTDTHLNDTGRQQAQDLAELLHSVRFDRAYSSTLSRSRETVEILRHGAQLEALDALREQRLGKFEGLRVGPADSAAAAEYERRSQDPDDSLDGGESANQHFQRVRAAMQEILSRHHSGNILIVGHGGTNKMILRALFGLSAGEADSIHQANDELYLIEIQRGAPPRLWKAIGNRNLGDL